MMKISYLGHSSFKISTGSVTILTDPFDPEKVGLPYPKVSADLVLSSHGHFDHRYLEAVTGEPFIITAPGEYEVQGVKVRGFQTFHDAQEGADRGKNTIYLVEVEDLSLCHLGDLGHLLAEKVVEEFEDLDVLFVPVGGVFTIDGAEAAKVVAQLEPKYVIPMHYRVDGMAESFGGLQPLEVFLREMGAEQVEPRAELTLNSKSLPEATEVVVLQRRFN